jgi:uncharacterized membrane protein
MPKENKKHSKTLVKKPVQKQASPVASKKVKEAPIKLIGSSNILRWKAPDYYTFERSPYWSLIVGLVSMVLALVLIYTQNFFPVIIIILAVIVTFQVAHEKPKTQEFAIDESGILARDVYLPFYELDSFWIAKHGSKSILYIGRVGTFKGPISIPLGEQGQIEVRNFLLRYLPEKLEYGEQLSEKLIRIFKL